MKRKRKIMISVLMTLMGITIIGIIFFPKATIFVQFSNNSKQKTLDNQISQGTPNTSETNNQTISETITKAEDNKNNSSDKLNHGNKNTTDHPDLEALEELSLNTLPTQFKNISKLINMEGNDFNDSPNETIQKIIDSYNTEMTLITHIKFSGSCTWNANWGKSNPFELDLFRKGFNVISKCGQECIKVKNGTAIFTDKVDKDCLDTYYLMAFAVFDPKHYTHISDESIEIIVEDDHITKDVYKISSPTKNLYFDRNNSKLLRVDLRYNEKESCYAYIDFLEHKLINNNTIPTKIQVIFKKIEALHAINRAVPEKMTLKIIPETVKF